MNICLLPIFLTSLSAWQSHVSGFVQVPGRHVAKTLSPSKPSLWANADSDDEEIKEINPQSSLEAKMKQWEASEDEIKAASLGGVVPPRSDSFDVVLYILFPFIVLSGFAFAFFPLIMDKIDTTSVGPPPTM